VAAALDAPAQVTQPLLDGVSFSSNETGSGVWRLVHPLAAVGTAVLQAHELPAPRSVLI
jgi:hypothetical protein